MPLTAHVEKSIARTDVRKESISKSLSFMSSFHQPCDVNHI